MSADSGAAHLQLTVGDVATLAAVHPSAVSRWRKRAADPFPEPISGGRSPLFNGAEVLAWLREHGHLATGQPDAAWYWAQAIRVLPAATPAGQREHLRGFVASLVALGAAVHQLLDPAHPRAEVPRALPDQQSALRDLADRVEHDHPALRGLIVAGLGEVTPASEVLTTVVGALDRALRDTEDDGRARDGAAELLDVALETLAGLSPGAPVTRTALADIFAATAGAWPGTRVLDPACGEAEVLTRLARAAAGGRTLVGGDIDPAVTRTARIRLALSGVEAEVVTADAIREPPPGWGGFDIVVIDPPSRAQTGKTADWLVLAIEALAPGGRAAITVPASALRANAAGDEVLRRGQVAAAILLPPTIRHGVRDTQALAILTTGHHERILVVDLTGRRPAGAADPVTEAAELVNAWLDAPDDAVRVLGAFTRRTRALARVLTNHEAQVEGVLRPARPRLPSDVEDAVAQLQQVLADHPELADTDKLAYALDRFAKVHHILGVRRRA